MGASKRVFTEEQEYRELESQEIEPLDFELCVGCHGKTWITVECKNNYSYYRIHKLINESNIQHICDKNRKWVHLSSESAVRSLLNSVL